jgi:hypothetical protein
MTIEEELQLCAQKMDHVFTEMVERNYSRMVEDNQTDDFIEAFQKAEAEAYPAIRDETLAKLRAWLEHDCKTLQ